MTLALQEAPRRAARAAAPERPVVVSVRDLWKSYGDRPVLRGVSLELRQGRVLGVLGPNGAGKTTLLETMEGLRRIERGEVEVLGRDMRTGHKEVQQQLGIQLQKTSLFQHLSVADTLRLYGRLYGRALKADEALARFGLKGHGHKLLGQLSGGQFQRFSLCLATLNDPRILFLDEPTTGLDPHARRLLWEIIRELRDGGTSIVLTTHYLDEAQALCDQVAILHQGVIAAVDTPQNLVDRLDGEKTIVVELEGPAPEAGARGLLGGVPYTVVEGRLHVPAREVHGSLQQVLAGVERGGLRVASLSIRTPTLEDVFIRMTSATPSTHAGS